MGRRFHFFAWARGDSSRSGRDFRRLLMLIGGVIGVFLLLAVARWVFWMDHGAGEHPHPKGPHGGMVVAIDEGASHHHAEILVEADGRIHLFLSGDEPDHPVEVRHQLVVAELKRKSDGVSGSLILRPDGNGTDEQKTSHFIGRLLPAMMDEVLSVSIANLALTRLEISFQFELTNRPDAGMEASELVKTLVLAPKGQYTAADIAVAEKAVPTEKYKELHVVHDVHTKVGDFLCPVTRAKADLRIRWQVSGRVYQFCCPPCIVDFIEAAQVSREPLIPPEQLVRTK